MTKLSQTIRVGLASAFFLLTATAASAQGPQPPAPLDAEGRSTAIAAAASALRERYVHPDVGAEAAEAIEAALADGSYDDIVEPGAFAARRMTCRR